MPNIENLKKVRDFIANEPEELFAMDTFEMQTSCGTVRCIGGAAAFLSESDYGLAHTEDIAAEFLEVTSGEGIHMFYAVWHPNRPEIAMADISRKDALAYLDKVIETGDVFVNMEGVI